MKFSLIGRFFCLLVVTTGGLFSCSPTSAPPPVVPATSPAVSLPKRGVITSMPLSTLMALQEEGNVLLFDVRPAFVLAFGKIPGATNWPKNAFDQQFPSHEPALKSAGMQGHQIVLYCTDAECPDARTVAEKLADKGYSVSVLEGGFHAWKESGMPTGQG